MKIKSHSESHIVELDDGSRWQTFPGQFEQSASLLALTTENERAFLFASLGSYANGRPRLDGLRRDPRIKRPVLAGGKVS